MGAIKTDNVAAILASVAGYGGQLAAVFHNYALIAKKIPSGFEGAINILDATVAVLKQALSLVEDEVEGKKVFSEEGLFYVRLLAQESANTLAKVEPILKEACLGREERKSKRKQKKRAELLSAGGNFNPLLLKLDEKHFLEIVEKAKWSWATDDIEKCMERLYDLQLHLLLVFEVVKVGMLSKELTSGKVDIQSIVAYYDRINRTADLIGIKTPKGRPGNRWSSGSFSSSECDTNSESSDSDASSIACKPTRKSFGCGPPPPPPARCIPGITPQAPPVPSTVTLSAVLPTTTKQETATVDEQHLTVVNNSPNLQVIDQSNPPAYCENKFSCTSLPTLAAPKSIVSQNNSRAISLPIEKAAETPVYPTEKLELKGKEEPLKPDYILKPAVPAGRLFESPSNGLGFRLKNLFRSKVSLAAEVKRVLSNSESHLLAFVVQKHELRRVPHSAFHTLEATHMKTILSQLNGNEWYKAFSNLDTYESSSITRLLHPYADGKIHERELVVLKVLDQNRFNAWVRLIGQLLKSGPFPYVANGRLLLAIVREKFVDGKPLKDSCGFAPPGPPPPPPILVRPSIQAPPSLPSPPALRRTTVSDLNGPPPPPIPSRWGFGGPPLPPQHSPGPPPPPGKAITPRLSDVAPITEYDASVALTTYNEYTLRSSESPDPALPRSWARATVTQESNDKRLILQRVSDFQRTGRSIIDIKLRLSEHQSAQISRLMEDLKSAERDSRFDWVWVEISLHNSTSEITDTILQGTPILATVMHLVAKRSLKSSYKALDVYNAMMKPPPRPPVSSPIIITPSPIAKKKKKYMDSSSDSDSDSTYRSSSDSSVGNVRRRLRKYRAKKVKKSTKGKYCLDSDSESDGEEEDVIAIKLQLKRGDDIVQVLLDKWTAEVEGNGKGKKVVA